MIPLNCYLGNDHDGFPWDDIVKCIEDRKLCNEDEDEGEDNDQDEDEEEEKPKELGAHIKLFKRRAGVFCEIEVEPRQLRNRNYWDAWVFTSGWQPWGTNHWGVTTWTERGTARCKNDKLDEIEIYRAEKGTVITVYDDR